MLSFKGEGRLLLLGGLEIYPFGALYVQDGGDLAIEDSLTVEENGTLDVGDSELDLAGITTISIGGTLSAGKINLSGVSMTLDKDLRIDAATLTTDPSTDISTEDHTFTWCVGDTSFDGEVTIGNGGGSTGQFVIEGNQAEVYADLILNGGRLRIDVTTSPAFIALSTALTAPSTSAIGGRGLERTTSNT